MGLFSKIKGQLANVIEWPNMEDYQIFYKFQNAEIKKGSKLIIRPGQDAIFLYQGRIDGIFTEDGEYDIESQIIPFLSTLKGFKFGFDSGIRAEILFVNTREFTVKWGTQNAINLPVPALPGGMPIRAFGTYTVKVADYELLVENIAGVTAEFTIDDVRTRISAMNDELLMKWISKEGKDMFNIQANASEISGGILQELKERLKDIGMTAVAYQIQSVSYPDSVRQMQEKAAGAAMVGDVNKYAQVQMANGMENGNGNAASSMASMQMGMMMGQQMVNNMQSSMQNNNQAQNAQPAGNSGVNFCPNCGAKTNGANFCPNCGQKLA